VQFLVILVVTLTCYIGGLPGCFMPCSAQSSARYRGLVLPQTSDPTEKRDGAGLRVGPQYCRCCTRGFTQLQMKIFEKQMVTVLKVYRLPFSSLFSKQKGIKTIYTAPTSY
jgi:hypothetical protein